MLGGGPFWPLMYYNASSSYHCIFSHAPYLSFLSATHPGGMALGIEHQYLSQPLATTDRKWGRVPQVPSGDSLRWQAMGGGAVTALPSFPLVWTTLCHHPWGCWAPSAPGSSSHLCGTVLIPTFLCSRPCLSTIRISAGRSGCCLGPCAGTGKRGGHSSVHHAGTGTGSGHFLVSHPGIWRKDGFSLAPCAVIRRSGERSLCQYKVYEELSAERDWTILGSDAANGVSGYVVPLRYTGSRVCWGPSASPMLTCNVVDMISGSKSYISSTMLSDLLLVSCLTVPIVPPPRRSLRELRSSSSYHTPPGLPVSPGPAP